MTLVQAAIGCILIANPEPNGYPGLWSAPGGLGPDYERRWQGVACRGAVRTQPESVLKSRKRAANDMSKEISIP